MCGDKVVKSIDKISIRIPINGEMGNVPMVYKSACTTREINEIGPLIRSALPHHERKMDFMGSWSSNEFANWGVGSKAAFQSKNVGVDENRKSIK